MLIAFIAVALSLALVVWSADRFVEGAAITARHFGMAPLLVGMVVIGFGTSAPEMAVSALSASQGSPGLALGNAYGSNIANIALILGVSALICPIVVRRHVLRREVSILLAVTALSIWLLFDGQLTRLDGGILLTVFLLLMGWTIIRAIRNHPAPEEAPAPGAMPVRMALTWLVMGLVLLIAGSQILVWGAITIASGFGVSELFIGLTIVALGTSLPELASSIAAVRKGEHDIALGNILGSNLFNTLVVVGIAAAIQPMAVTSDVLQRDIPVMMMLTISVLALGYRFRKSALSARLKGAVLMMCYMGYTLYLLNTTTQVAG